eukprot:snap_masked-scaffold_36-processed-gene-0.32-mRNA-1 protein AED:1.00 eAED:1.00 QI:0/-1/0/0/-1/1/1/0/1008
MDKSKRSLQESDSPTQRYKELVHENTLLRKDILSFIRREKIRFIEYHKKIQMENKGDTESFILIDHLPLREVSLPPYSEGKKELQELAQDICSDVKRYLRASDLVHKGSADILKATVSKILDFLLQKRFSKEKCIGKIKKILFYCDFLKENSSSHNLTLLCVMVHLCRALASKKDLFYRQMFHFYTLVFESNMKIFQAHSSHFEKITKAHESHLRNVQQLDENMNSQKKKISLLKNQMRQNTFQHESNVEALNMTLAEKERFQNLAEDKATKLEAKLADVTQQMRSGQEKNNILAARNKNLSLRITQLESFVSLKNDPKEKPLEEKITEIEILGSETELLLKTIYQLQKEKAELEITCNKLQERSSELKNKLDVCATGRTKLSKEYDYYKKSYSQLVQETIHLKIQANGVKRDLKCFELENRHLRSKNKDLSMQVYGKVTRILKKFFKLSVKNEDKGCSKSSTQNKGQSFLPSGSVTNFECLDSKLKTLGVIFNNILVELATVSAKRLNSLKLVHELEKAYEEKKNELEQSCEKFIFYILTNQFKLLTATEKEKESGLLSRIISEKLNNRTGEVKQDSKIISPTYTAQTQCCSQFFQKDTGTLTEDPRGSKLARQLDKGFLHRLNKGLKQKTSVQSLLFSLPTTEGLSSSKNGYGELSVKEQSVNTDRDAKLISSKGINTEFMLVDYKELVATKQELETTKINYKVACEERKNMISLAQKRKEIVNLFKQRSLTAENEVAVLLKEGKSLKQQIENLRRELGQKNRYINVLKEDKKRQDSALDVFSTENKNLRNKLDNIREDKLRNKAKFENMNIQKSKKESLLEKTAILEKEKKKLCENKTELEKRVDCLRTQCKTGTSKILTLEAELKELKKDLQWKQLRLLEVLAKCFCSKSKCMELEKAALEFSSKVHKLVDILPSVILDSCESIYTHFNKANPENIDGSLVNLTFTTADLDTILNKNSTRLSGEKNKQILRSICSRLLDSSGQKSCVDSVKSAINKILQNIIKQ